MHISSHSPGSLITTYLLQTLRSRHLHTTLNHPLHRYQGKPAMTAATKNCGDHDDVNKKRRKLIAVIGLIVIVFALVVFLVWVIIHPSKPRFVLQDVTVFAFNLSLAPNSLTSNIQLTLSARNPNNKIGIYYQKLDVFASYRNQQITLPTMLQRTYQDHPDDTTWSPFLYGNAIPVAPFLEERLSQDLNAGMVLLEVKVFGKLRWKVGSWISGRYQINAHCPAYISFGDRSKGIQVDSAIKYQLVQACSVDTFLVTS